MRVQVVTVNHGTTEYADLFLRSLLAHHPDRSELAVLVLDNESGDVHRLDWARALGVRIRASGWSLDASVNTHGEVLRAAVLAEPDCDAYLFADSDVCFVTDDTVGAMARELAANPGAFAVEAVWANEDGTVFHHRAGPPMGRSRIRESVRFAGGDWGEPYEFDVDYGDRVHPFCVLVRNDAPFRTTVELLGLSPAMTQCVRGGMFWDTFGLLTQVMRTHGRVWVTSTQQVVHFAGASWQPEWAADKAARRDALMGRYPLDRLR
ncbi:Glycosyltransferase, GT2 family [Actinopolymorpha cephalotaxi]|uniref:Glycosyltransferase, GT2 family n=1 Tax=Actinopolymorpha cephalotaxi TaxID=504797 RepID=A0A1I2WMF9_9ACTN|nr:hypothetical protein [Actinopolymorpha cephalotaxi]NYH85033.1 hypothetical protein [Actinopolymorpha cephalotaxi]SFH02444.1 Glycosyltransferase, GT2 family [Actinopolymorpha cephalotaxi]